VDKDYRVEFSIAEGGLVASMRIVPASPEVSNLNAEEIFKAIQDERISYGVIPGEIEKTVRMNVFNQWVIIARGEKPEEGKDGSVKFHFNTERSKIQLKEDESGKVNLRDLNLIQNVKKGDILCELIPPAAGMPGMSVKGEEIPSKPGKEAKMPAGKNITTSADRSHMYSAIDGMVLWFENAVNVEPCYVVHDVDASVGNIRFNGSVVVQGEVGDGYEIHAGEDITIATTVGNVILEAGGNIKIGGGILGQEKAVITANGRIHTRFIQDAHVKSEKDIIVDGYIRNSLVSAVGPVLVKNSNGFIVTSKVSSDSWIYCHTVGQEDAGVETELSIGHSPVLQKEGERLKEEIAGKIPDFLKLQSSLSKLRVLKSTSELSRQQEMLYEKILEAMLTLRKNLSQKNALILEIAEKIHRTHQGNIYIEGTLHDRTDIHIGLANMTNKGTKAGVHFYLKDGQISEAEFVMAPDVKKLLESGE